MKPDIQILHLVEGAKKATGLTIVIDVCRAFSTAAFLASGGAREIFTVGTLQEAFDLREHHPDCFLVGEVKGRKPEGFDYGNSPSEILRNKSIGKSAIHRTSAGTQGIINAKRADEILTGAFVNAGAIIRYIQKTNPNIISFVCMGKEAKQKCIEDTLCAEFLRSRMIGNELDFSTIAKRIKESETGIKFRSPNYPWLPEEDLDLCLSLDIFDFVLRCDSNMSQPHLQRIDI